MRRWTAVLAVLAALTAACGPTAASVGHARHDSWVRIHDPAFTAGPSHSVVAIAAPGDGYRSWTAVGSVQDRRVTPAVWSAREGTGWGRAELYLGDAREAVASAAAVHAGRVVVVGTAVTALGDRDPRIWTATEGATWAPVPVPGGPGDQSLTAVAAGPLGFVAAGNDHSNGRTVPVVWFSGDGTSWQRAAGPFDAGQTIEGLAVGRSGLVAVGTLQTSGDVDGMVWFSADGATWRTVPLGSAGFTGPATQHVHGATATAAGGFVAVGDDNNADRRFAVIWTSADGITWQRQPPSPDMGEYATAESTEGVSATSVAGSGPLVAVGGGYSLQLWNSPDGRRWTRDESPDRTVDSGDSAHVATDGRVLLILTGTGLLLFRGPTGGWTNTTGDQAVFPTSPSSASIGPLVRYGEDVVASGYDRGERALWLSSDGRTWDRQHTSEGLLAKGRIDALTTFGGMVVGVGTADHPSNPDDNVAAVWISRNGGVSWERVAETNPAFFVRGSTQMFAATGFQGGLVAVGLSYDIHATIDAQAWFSPDGLTWRRVTEPAAWSGLGDQALTAVCPLPDGGVVALGFTAGTGDQDTWAWVSHDGTTWERASGPGAAVLGGDGHQGSRSCAASRDAVWAAAAVPGQGGSDGALWRTADGLTWVSAPGPFSSDEADFLTTVTADGDRIVVSGLEGDDAVLYSSGDDGHTWQKRTGAVFAGFGTQQVTRLAIVGDEVVAAGIDGSSGAVWIGPAP